MQEFACDAGDLGLSPGSGRFPGEGNCNPLQYLPGKIPWTEEPGELQSKGLKELDTTEQLSTYSIKHNLDNISGR